MGFHRWQPTRLHLPWDSLGKNNGVGCHFLLQCMNVKSENEVAQSCPTLSDPMDCSLPGYSIHGIFQARVLKWAAIAFSISSDRYIYFRSCNKKALSAHLHWCQPPICPWIFAQVSTPRSYPALQAEVCSAGASVALFSAP